MSMMSTTPLLFSSPGSRSSLDLFAGRGSSSALYKFIEKIKKKSEIRRLFDPWIRDPGSGIGFFRIPDPKPIFLRAYGQFFE
jgi:hypothetical protein